MKAKVLKTVEIELGPEELAKLFSSFNDEEQVQFMRAVADEFIGWKSSEFWSQMEAVRKLLDSVSAEESYRTRDVWLYMANGLPRQR